MWTPTKSRLIRAAAFTAPALQVVLAALLVLGARAASGQPAMMDPSQMSGIPRPDPAVPTGTVTVRLIRGDLAHAIVDSPVELVNQAEPDNPKTGKTDAAGRATFSGLTSGIYQARAAIGEKSLSSQPIEVMPSPSPGVRVMLVFPKSAEDEQKEIGTPDGKARVDNTAAPGTLLFKAVDGNGQPLPGLPVQLVRATRESQKVEPLPPQTTGPDGTVRYTDLKTDANLGYMVSVQKDGRSQSSQPFSLNPSHGSVLALSVMNVSREVSALYIANGSHIIFELEDDNVQVIENLILINPLPLPIDPGPGGLRFPLASGALSAQTLPGVPASLTVDSSQEGAPALQLKGMVPPGQIMLRVGFILKHRGELTFRQVSSVRIEALKVAIMKLPDLKVEGVTDSEDRKLNGRDFIVASVNAPSAGGPIELMITGLPTDFYVLRILAALGALAIALAFTYLAVYSKAGEDSEEEHKQRQKLMARREALLDELVRSEADGSAPSAGKGAKKGKSAAQLRAELEDIYRRLDESDG